MLRFIVPIGLFLSLSVAFANGLSCIYLLTGDKVRYSPIAMIYGGVDVHPRSQMYVLTAEKKLQPELPEKFNYSEVIVNGKMVSHRFIVQLKEPTSLQTEVLENLGIKAEYLAEKSETGEAQLQVELPIPSRINEKLNLEVGKTPISYLAVATGLNTQTRSRFFAEGVVTVAVDEINSLSQASIQTIPGFYKLSNSKLWPRLKYLLKEIYRDIDLGNNFSQNLNSKLTLSEKLQIAEELLLAAENAAVLMSKPDASRIETVRDLMSAMTAAEAKLIRSK